MDTFFSILGEWLIILALVAANGFFVAAEFALVRMRASQLQPMAKVGGWRVRLALRALKNLDATLSATQLGVTLASLGLGWVGEPFVAHRFAPLLARAGVTGEHAIEGISFGVAFVVITFLHIVLGELGPKWVALQRPKRVTLLAGGPLVVFYYTFFPFIWLLNRAASQLLAWLGLEPVAGEQAPSAEELEYVFSHARHAHPGDALINRLMVRSLRLRDTQAQQIMRPRDQIVALHLDRPHAENLRLAQTSGFSRFPVCRAGLDEVAGVLLVREWLWQIQALGPDAPFEPLLRPALTFTVKTPIHAMLELFRKSRTHLALVLDDEGNTAGLVSLEDVLEEIVGDIRDEFDIERGPVFEHTENAIVVSGRFTMRELQAETGWNFPDLQPRENVSVWAIRQFGHEPRRGENVTVGEMRVTAEDMAVERLRRVRVERLPVVG